MQKTDKFNRIANNMLKSDKFYTVLTQCFSILLILQFLVICYVNLCQNQNHIGYDPSALYLKAIEIWKQKTLFPPNYADQTSLMIDSPAPLAALLFGLTGNIFVAYGVANILGKDESLISHVKDRPGHDRRYAIDNTKITSELGWSPGYTFEQGIAETICWYSDNEEWMENVISGNYIAYYAKMYGDRIS
jgi:hypothetical protein